MTPIKHGLVSRYNRGCRCDECRAAASAYRMRTRKKAGVSRRRPGGTPGDHDYRWMDDARCRTVETRVFFPTKNHADGLAKSLCAVCPVQGECLSYAIATDQPDGIWGGMCFDERERYREQIA